MPFPLPSPFGPSSARRRAIAKQQRRQQVAQWRFNAARRLIRVVHWLAHGHAGGPEKPRASEDRGLIYEHPTGQVILFERSTDAGMQAVLKASADGPVVFTREQLDMLSLRIDGWLNAPIAPRVRVIR